MRKGQHQREKQEGAMIRDTQHGGEKVLNTSVSQPAHCQFTLTCPGYNDILNLVKFIKNIFHSVKFCNHAGQ